MNHFLSGTKLHEEYRLMYGSHLDVAETARQVHAKTLILTHLLPHLDRPGVKERMVAEMAAVFSGRIIVGEDLMTTLLSSAERGTAD
jgi:ribonuclease Z